MKRKLGLVQAFQADPLLLILDEPTEGLDPLMQESFYGLLADARNRGRTVFMSSHVLPEVERVCDRIAVLRKGQVVLLSSVEDAQKLASRPVRVALQHADRSIALSGPQISVGNGSVAGGISGGAHPYFHPVVMGALVSVSLTLSTIPVMEIETGFIDLVPVRPVTRHWIVTRSILLALIFTVYLLAMMALGTWIGLRYFAAKGAGWPSATS
jgi:energy-coupling factor transporter ATP-binding protein EcfA2